MFPAGGEREGGRGQIIFSRDFRTWRRSNEVLNFSGRGGYKFRGVNGAAEDSPEEDTRRNYRGLCGAFNGKSRSRGSGGSGDEDPEKFQAHFNPAREKPSSNKNLIYFQWHKSLPLAG